MTDLAIIVTVVLLNTAIVMLVGARAWTRHRERVVERRERRRLALQREIAALEHEMFRGPFRDHPPGCFQCHWRDYP